MPARSFSLPTADKVCLLFGLKLLASVDFSRKLAADRGEGGSFIARDGGKRVFVRWSKDEKEVLDRAQKQKLFNDNVQQTIVRTPCLLYTKRRSEYTIAAFEFVNPRHPRLSAARLVQILHSGLNELRKIPIGALSGVYPTKTSGRYLSEFSRLLANLKLSRRLGEKRAKAFFEYFLVNAKPRALSFVHSDLAPHNFTINRRGQLVLFDLEKSVVGDPLEDLARLLNFYLIHRPQVHRRLSELDLAADKNRLNAFRLMKAVFLANHYAIRHEQTFGTMSKVSMRLWLKIAGRIVAGAALLSKAERRSLLGWERRFLSEEALAEQKRYVRFSPESK